MQRKFEIVFFGLFLAAVLLAMTFFTFNYGTIK